MLGVTFLFTLTLPAGVTAFAGVQSLCWLAAAVTLYCSKKDDRGQLGTKTFRGLKALFSEPMAPQSRISNRVAIIKHYQVVTYFALTFAASWFGALIVAAPHLGRHVPVPKMTGILMFPVMLLGPSLAAIVLTGIVDGKSGLRNLLSRTLLARFPARWYATLIIPPVLLLSVLLLMETFVSPTYAPNHFFIGILFGIPAGFLEEIGWTGYAFPKMHVPNDGLTPSILLGTLWALWHLPVVNYIGSVTPHGRYWLPFFAAFGLAMTAMRVLIAWIYTNTRSVLLAQLMHVSSTGSLVFFSPPRVTALQEVTWYALYGAVLWVAVATVVRTFGKRLALQGIQGQSN